jgi:hypothetical protein
MGVQFKARNSTAHVKEEEDSNGMVVEIRIEGQQRSKSSHWNS